MANENTIETNVKEKDSKALILENIYDFVEIALLALIMVAVLFAFFIRIVGVEGASMESTLQEGDRLVLSKMFYSPERGDIVVINRENDTPLIKRVIAVEGETVEFDVIANQVLIDGVPLDETYLDEGCITNPKQIVGPVTVPEDHVFVLGDNRVVSLDSRMPQLLGCDNINGCISEDYILGKAVLRFLPFNKFGGLY